VHTHVEMNSTHVTKPNVGQLPTRFSAGRIGTSIHVERFQYSMVKVRYLLLHAAFQVGNPEWFIFLSDSCAPLVSCRSAHAYLNAHKGRSFLGPDGTEPSGADQMATAERAKYAEAFHRVCPKCATVGVEPQHYLHTAGWFGVWREHAQLLLDKEREHDEAMRDWVGVRDLPGIPDETHWGTLFTRYQLPMWGRLLTFMLRGSAKGGHPRIFQSQDIGLVENETAKEAAKDGEKLKYLFARKFATTHEVDIKLRTRIAAGNGF